MDILLGVQLLLVYFWIEYRLVIYVAWIAIGPVIVEAIRKRTTYPRMGYARMANQGATAVRIILICVVGIALLSLITALIFVLSGYPVQSNWSNVIKIAAVLFIPVIFGLLTYEHKVYRWFVYGLALGLGGLYFMLREPREIHIYIVILGGIITLIGITIFVDFLKKNPRQPGETSDVG
ncbi:hypothetical protein AMJ52_07965 [candidate division TA06 bacterium DG_78]|uniref:Uncharacterized protein n=1 Tax=candidate division TA06 bacterium DG_78 TaxID=1703772 RepID=A0A0S7YCM1_UNCT6|nr:MAG: hypothetical protein AMJ52_07965 [candidate division TA06 bacterium DG_78]